MNAIDFTRDQMMAGQTVYREFIDTFYHATRSPWQYLLPSNQDVYNPHLLVQSIQPVEKLTQCIESPQSMSVQMDPHFHHTPSHASADGEIVFVLTCKVEQQYTMSRKESDELSDRKKLKLVKWKVRFVKDQKNYPNGSSPLFVIANDIAPLLNIRSGHVSSTVNHFDHHLKRMMMLPPKKAGMIMQQIVLTMDGFKKLALSRQMFVGQVEEMFKQQLQQET